MQKRLEDKKIILVTGGSGFIGSHFIEKCLDNGHKIINIDKLTYASNLDVKFKGDYSFINKDISEIKDIPNCDIIVNFAAESHVDNSINESINFIKSNIIGVYNILEIIKNKKMKSMLNAQNYSIPIFFQISTDEVFGDIDEGSFLEDDRHLASNPYSATKSAAEQLVFAWARTYDIPFLMSRTTNNYGPRQHKEKLIPSAITKLLKEEKVEIHGTGKHVRNWIHVKDNVDALYTIINSGEINNVYHIASSEEYSVNEIVKLICKSMGKDFNSSTKNVLDRSGADKRYALNIEKISKLGWKQKLTLSDSIEDIVKSYRERT